MLADTLVRAAGAFEDQLYGEHSDDFAYDPDAPPATRLRQVKSSRSWPAPLYKVAPCGFLLYGSIFLWDMYENLGHFRDQMTRFFEARDPSRHSLLLVLGARLRDEMPTMTAEEEKTVVYLWEVDKVAEAGLVTWFHIGKTDFPKKRWWAHVSAKGVNHVVRELKAKAIFNHLFQATVRKPGASRQGLNVNLLDRGSGTTSIPPAERAELQDKAVIYYNGHPDERVPQANDARRDPVCYASALLAIRTNPSQKMLHIAKLLRGEQASILARLKHGRSPLPVAAFGASFPANVLPHAKQRERAKAQALVTPLITAPPQKRNSRETHAEMVQ